MHPIRKKICATPNWTTAITFFEQIYASDTRGFEDESNEGSDLGIPPFNMYELQRSLNKMAKGKTSDPNGLVLEMFLYSGSDIQQLLEIYNEMIRLGSFPAN